MAGRKKSSKVSFFARGVSVFGPFGEFRPATGFVAAVLRRNEHFFFGWLSRLLQVFLLWRVSVARKLSYPCLLHAFAHLPHLLRQERSELFPIHHGRIHLPYFETALLHNGRTGQVAAFHLVEYSSDVGLDKGVVFDAIGGKGGVLPADTVQQKIILAGLQRGVTGEGTIG